MILFGYCSMKLISDSEWVPIGSRFSNGVLQALMVLFSRRPPKVIWNT